MQCLLSGPAADGCVITEPHSDHITTAQVGVLWLHVDIVGSPAHAALASDVGFNAIDAAATVTRALRGLEAELNVSPPAPYDVYQHPINLNPGMIRGGDWTSTVAAQSPCPTGSLNTQASAPLNCAGAWRTPLVPTTATTDARHFVRRGIPAVCFGPLAEDVHGIDERVSISSILRTATVLAAFIQQWCGVAA